MLSSGGKLLKRLEVPHITLSVNSKNPFVIILNAWKIANIIKEYDINIVHVRSRAPAFSCFIACKLAKVKLVVTFHGVYSHKGVFKKWYNKIMLQGDIVIAVSDFVKEHIAEIYHYPKDKIITIDRWVNTKIFNPKNIDQEVLEQYRQKWNLDSGKNIFLFPARFSSWKGHEYIIEVMNLIKDLPFKCIFIGDMQNNFKYISKLQDIIKGRSLEDRIFMADSSTYMPTLYSMADYVLVASQRPEAFGRVAIEAQAMEKIVICTAIGAPKFYIKDKENGFLIPRHEVKVAAKILRDIVTMPKKEKQRVAHNAYLYAKENFDSNIKCAQTLELYYKLLQ